MTHSFLPITSRRHKLISLPINVYFKICYILEREQCFTELEIVLYLSPYDFTASFNFLFPTIVVVDTDQYDKYQKFIHTRQRPFGSKDLFIIKQDSSVRVNNRAPLRSKCYIVLGSKHAQQYVPVGYQAFERYVTLVENRWLCYPHLDDSYKCFELVFRAELFDEDAFRSSGYILSSESFGCSFHLVMLARVFLRAIRPRMWRFESYTGCNELKSDYTETYKLYCNLNRIYFPMSNFYPMNISKDAVLYSPKCSFEFIKDIDQFTALHEYNIPNTGWNKMRGLHEESELEEQEMSLKRKVWKSLYKPSAKFITIDLFHNVKSVKVDSFFSKKSKKSFVLIDCSRAATTNTKAFEFVSTNHSYLCSKIQRKRCFSGRKIRTPEEIYLEKSCLNVKLNHNFNISSLPNYIHLGYKDFLNEKLESVDITIFNPNLEREEEKLFKEEQQKTSGSYISKNPSLKNLESEINGSLGLIDSARIYKYLYGDSHVWKNIQFLRQKIKEDLVNVFLKRSSIEGWDQEEPFRLRVFNKYSYSLDMAQTIGEVNDWFKVNMY